MIIKLDLLENSLDYLDLSLEHFICADEWGEHEEKFCNKSKKIKWKMAFLNLVQSLELLIKECLRNYSPILVYEKIDIPINENSKTVSGVNGLERLSNCNPNLFSKDNKSFIKECILIRNSFMHYVVEIDSTKIKPKYCILYKLFCELLKGELGSNAKMDEIINKYKPYTDNILLFTEDFIVFRNVEMRENDYREFMKEIANNKNTGYFVDKQNRKYKRIAYGSEPLFNKENSHEFCPDCTAAIGEYHYALCDFEVCPVCGQQKLSCDCGLEICVGDMNFN